MLQAPTPTSGDVGRKIFAVQVGGRRSPVSKPQPRARDRPTPRVLPSVSGRKMAPLQCPGRRSEEVRRGSRSPSREGGGEGPRRTRVRTPCRDLPERGDEGHRSGPRMRPRSHTCDQKFPFGLTFENFKSVIWPKMSCGVLGTLPRLRRPDYRLEIFKSKAERKFLVARV